MSEQAAQLSDTCQSCGVLCTGWAVQLTREGRLRWEVEWECDACGTISHEGKWGSAPPEVRNVILAQHGYHCLQLADRESRGGAILKAFRDAFDLTIRQAQESASKLKKTGYEGTYVETLFLSELLQGGGVATVLRPGSCA